LPYNGLLGRLALAQFMVAAHYAYNMIKIPATWGVQTIRADLRDAVYCVEEMDKAAVIGKPGGPSKAMLGGLDFYLSLARKRSSPEPATIVCEAVGPVPHNGKLVSKIAMTKKVPLGDGTSRTFTSVPCSLLNRKARSSPSFWRTLTCSPGIR
jgi:hypothetical protein